MDDTYSISSFGVLTLNTGEVISIVGDQVVVKAASNPPAMGTVVYSEKGKLGIVADIIGPVDKPYFVVKPQGNAKVSVGDRVKSN
jgi:rRNA processing protein Gar1